MAEFDLGKCCHHDLSSLEAKVLEQRYQIEYNCSNASGRDDSVL